MPRRDNGSTEVELMARNRELRSGRPRLEVQGRTVVLIDEFLENAMLLHAALLAVHSKARVRRLWRRHGRCARRFGI